jgi:hypothetical protein
VCVRETLSTDKTIVLMSTDNDFPPASLVRQTPTLTCDSVVYISLVVHSVCLSVPRSLSLYPYPFVSARVHFLGTVERVKAFREARMRLDQLTRSQENHRSSQLAELSDTQVSSAHLCVCVCVCACVCVCVCIYLYTHTRVCVCVYLCM